jgi:DNA-binding CsgD family transcriptional regulator/sugar-specific transcriptional regulator TrmB
MGANVLEALGISQVGEAVYRTLLAQPGWSVAEIAGYLRVSERTVRSALDELADLSLLRPTSGEIDILQPVSPDVGLAVLLAESEAQMLRQQRQIEAARSAVAAIAAEYRSSSDGSAVIRHDGMDAVRRCIAELAERVTREIVSLNPNHTQSPDAKEASRPLNEAVLQRGVAIRSVYQQSMRNHGQIVAYARWLTELGAQVRVAPALPMLLIVYDGETALVPIDPEHTRQGALELRTPGVVAAMQALFEQTWLAASPLGEPETMDESGLDPLEQHMLHLLGDGFTDEVVARKVGLSLRTLRRMMSEVMDRLGARSRFQAGKEATLRGWL